MNGNGTNSQGTGNGRHMRCALFVDFDNVYLGLRQLDPQAAEAFANDPGRWLERLETGRDAEGEFRRRFLVRACYLNPSVFAQFRPFFTRAGFRVIDCPSLTQQGKSSADINMVLDAVDALSAPTRYDEFVIVSADADFTPLALRCRAADRRVTIITAGPAASAYRAVADSVLTADDLAELVTTSVVPRATDSVVPGAADSAAPGGPVLTRTTDSVAPGGPVLTRTDSAAPGEPMVTRTDSAAPGEPLVNSTTDSVTPGANDQASTRRPLPGLGETTAPKPTIPRVRAGYPAAAPSRAAQAVGRLLGSNPGPVAGSALAQAALAVDPSLPESSWEGLGFAAWLAANVPEADFSPRPAPGYGWDRHRFTEADLPAGEPAELTPLQRQVTNVTDIPSLSTAQYATLLKALARDVNAHPFHRTETSKRVRDTCQDAGVAVGRSSVNFVIQGLLYSGLKLQAPVSATELAEGWAGNVEGLCHGARMELGDDGQAQVRSWVGGGLIAAA